MSQILPDQGRNPVFPPPIGLIFPADPNMPLPVILAVTIPRQGLATTYQPRDFHWFIKWDVGMHNGSMRQRVIDLNTIDDHLVYWGPRTQDVGTQTLEARIFQLGSIPLGSRQALEALSLHIPVFSPDGNWNCQDWTKAFLRAAVNNRILHPGYVEPAIAGAESLPPVVRSVRALR